MANAKKCSQINCPYQRLSSDDCNFEDCPYWTEAIDPQEVISVIGNYIADLVVQKLKAEKEKGNNTVVVDCAHICEDCKYQKLPPYIEPCESCSIKEPDMTTFIDNFEPKEE